MTAKPPAPFNGFPPGRPRVFSLPTGFIQDLLPLIDDLAELQVTLFTFYAVQQREGRARFLVADDYLTNDGLMQALAAYNTATTPADTLAQAIERACVRGTLLRATVEVEGEQETLFFINAEPGRRAVAQIERGRWQSAGQDGKVEILPERPNAYQLYEENIGPLTPLIADALKDAEGEYPSGWLEEAIRTATESNARSWAFVRAVLERRKKEGNGYEVATKSAERDGRRFVSGKYADLIDH